MDGRGMMETRIQLISFASRESMAERLAELVALRIKASLHKKGHAYMAVSGGSTPVKLYENLSQQDLDWGAVCTVLADERWVDTYHEASNERLIKETFQRNKASELEVIGLKENTPTPRAAIKAVDEKLSHLPDMLDVAVLGMGTDGHTASWFPYSEGLDEALSLDAGCVAAISAKRSDVTGPNTDRITLTFTMIEKAELIILMMNGTEKRMAFEWVVEQGPIEEAPIRALLQSRPDMWACWAP